MGFAVASLIVPALAAPFSLLGSGEAYKETTLPLPSLGTRAPRFGTTMRLAQERSKARPPEWGRGQYEQYPRPARGSFDEQAPARNGRTLMEYIVRQKIPRTLLTAPILKLTTKCKL